jgi:Transcriptional regulator, AbiEi antitoxin, Type IV TA system/Transcriptional regulator, AbiEi antitoxin N-terminal domain
MTKRKDTKLKWLEHNLPDGLHVDASWLARQGYSTSLRSQYVAAGWLEHPARGVYRRPGRALTWEQAVISLQMLLKRPFAVGGRTALELQGYGHYLRQDAKEVHLYGPEHPPGWLKELRLDTSFVYHNSRRLFGDEAALRASSDFNGHSEENGGDRLAVTEHGLTVLRSGPWDWPLLISSPERAILELLDELPNRESFHQADMLMEGLTNLSPRRLQELLERCHSVKVKRLFFFFADRHQHAWQKHLDKQAINLGKGVRLLAKGGKFNSAYQITVPEELNAVR